MPLQSSGAISLQNLATEFGGAAPHALNEYYRGGGRVPNASQNNSIPTSGTIGLGHFYGGVNRLQFNLTISANTNNYVLNTAKVAGYVAGVSDVILTINAGVTVSSSSTGLHALDVDTSWAAGDSVTIINNGTITGRGGDGGRGSGSSAVAASGGAGGPALRAQRPVSITNNGTIGGGGGGGGGGAARLFTAVDKMTTYYYYTGGGGGGGGAGGATGGAAGETTNTPISRNAAAGNASGLTTAGGGGVGAITTGTAGGTGGNGGSGGGLGAAGASGTAGSRNAAAGGPQSGGAGGAAVAGNGNITWVATGTRLGAIT